MYCLASQKCFCESIALNLLLWNNLPTFYHGKDQLCPPPVVKIYCYVFLLLTSIDEKILFPPHLILYKHNLLILERGGGSD